MFYKLLVVSILFTLAAVGSLHATIVQKVLVVNPSKELTRTIPVKVLLPREAKPENIVDAGGFEIVYDFSAGQYIGTQDVTLGPGESVTKVIEIADVWAMKKEKEEVKELEDSINKTVDKLKESQLYQQAKGVQDDVRKKIEEIRELQNKSFASPDEQIAAYREVQAKLKEIESQLNKIGNLMVQQAPPEMFGLGHVTIKTIWKIIIGIIVLLGVLSVIFFAVWQSQLARMPKVEMEETPSLEKELESKEKGEEGR